MTKELQSLEGEIGARDVRAVVSAASDPVPGTGGHYRFLDLTGGLKPYLLERIDNNRGAVTILGYATSTTHYLSDQPDPATRVDHPAAVPGTRGGLGQRR